MRKNEWSRLHAGMVVLARTGPSTPLAKMAPLEVIDPSPREVNVWTPSSSSHRLVSVIRVSPVGILPGDAQGIYLQADVDDPAKKAWPQQFSAIHHLPFNEPIVVDVRHVESLAVGERTRSFWSTVEDWASWEQARKDRERRKRDRHLAMRNRAEDLAKAGHAAGRSQFKMTRCAAWVDDVDGFADWYRTLNRFEKASIRIEFEVRPGPDLIRPECPVCEGRGCEECDHQGLQLLTDEEGDEQ